MAAMELGAEYGLEISPHPYNSHVYRLHELAQVVETYGLPGGEPPEAYDEYQRREFEHYIEVQVWADAPLARWIERGE